MAPKKADKVKLEIKKENVKKVKAKAPVSKAVQKKKPIEKIIPIPVEKEKKVVIAKKPAGFIRLQTAEGWMRMMKKQKALKK